MFKQALIAIVYVLLAVGIKTTNTAGIGNVVKNNEQLQLNLCMSGLSGRGGQLLWFSDRKAYLDQLYICAKTTHRSRMRKAARELRGSKQTSPSNVMEDKLRKLKIDLGQCNRRFGDLLTKLQELVDDEQVQESVPQGSDKFRL